VKLTAKFKILFSLIFIAVFLISSVSTFLFLTYKNSVVEKPQKLNTKGDIQVKKIEGEINILLLGYGGAGHEGGTLSDSILILNLNTEKKHAALIAVPRDTWVELPIRSDLKENHKINAAYAIGGDHAKYPLKEPIFQGESGGGEMAKYAVSQIVGMPIDYFVSVSFDGFASAIDILGGIEVEVLVTFDDYFYPVKGLENESCGKSAAEIAELSSTQSGFELEKQFECRYEHLHFDKGKTQIDGESALKFVRSRHSSEHGGDFARGQRQQAVLFGIKDKLLELGAADDAVSFFNKFAEVLKTDIDEAALLSLIASLGNSSDYSIKEVNLTEENVFSATKSLDGQFILIPKLGEGIWSGVQSYVREEISQ
jgi:anionic cell wall polymer biosynthesis LytR-Cps2A-Psr (LCP) family protein